MLFKEQGYEAFVAEKIRKAKKTAEQGNTMSLSEACQHWKQNADLRAEKSERFYRQERDVVYG